MPYLILTITIQALSIFHVVRTGRDMRWIFLILFIPLAGSLIYFAVELLPSLNQNLTARRAMRRLHDTVDPNRGVRRGELDYEANRSVDSASRLAEELTKTGRYDEAIAVCNEARTGLFEDDPKILLPLAEAQFGAKRYDEAVATLEYLRDKNPQLHAPDGHLLYARALEKSGATDRALEEYESVARYYPGAEARVRRALLYKELGQAEQAGTLFAAILKDARIAPKHFRKTQREWLELARREHEATTRRG